MIYVLVYKGVDHITVEFTPEAVYEIQILILKGNQFFHLHAQEAVKEFVVDTTSIMSVEPTKNELVFKVFYEK